MRKTPPLYVLKLKTKHNDNWQYFNEHIITSPNKVDEMSFEFFLYDDEKKARKTMMDLICQHREDIKAMKLVELSHYAPYPEHQVLWYKEFK